MGSALSGNYCGRDSRKWTVEESLSLPVRVVRDRLIPGATGTFTWTRGGVATASVGYQVAATVEAPGIELRYRTSGGGLVVVPVWLDTTGSSVGGPRWWFLCPAVRRGVPCRKRTSRLFLPPGVQWFGCRTCHDLTYRSCQESHWLERVFGRLKTDPEAGRALVDRLKGRGLGPAVSWA